MKEKNINKEAGKNNQTQLRSPGRNVGGEKNYRQSNKKNKNKKAALKVSAQN